ncbi:hypothetical protein D3227_36450 [Mesorhizobium waimense]|uniref:Uncharacterized protein n=1 Tax=Mesorhizobium waimense TaxID=1300307 RepID=A0A3A5JYM3_9HYPH|nr:hypothetical protein [Mesorhizobium waimense]RJT27265.1 hypothetical protein D3227_36450 [Mesorhizobium waimense]
MTKIEYYCVLGIKRDQSQFFCADRANFYELGKGTQGVAMFERLKAWFRRTFGIYSVKNDAILLYYLSTLDVRARWLRSRGVALDPDGIGLLEELVERRNKLENCPPGTYSEGDAWIEVYRLERLMALLEPFHNLIAEIRLRLDEALAERASAEPRLRAAFILAEANAFDRSKSPY